MLLFRECIIIGMEFKNINECWLKHIGLVKLFGLVHVKLLGQKLHLPSKNKIKHLII